MWCPIVYMASPEVNEACGARSEIHSIHNSLWEIFENGEEESHYPKIDDSGECHLNNSPILCYKSFQQVARNPLHNFLQILKYLIKHELLIIATWNRRTFNTTPYNSHYNHACWIKCNLIRSSPDDRIRSDQSYLIRSTDNSNGNLYSR